MVVSKGLCSRWSASDCVECCNVLGMCMYYVMVQHVYEDNKDKRILAQTEKQNIATEKQICGKRL